MSDDETREACVLAGGEFYRTYGQERVRFPGDIVLTLDHVLLKPYVASLLVAKVRAKGRQIWPTDGGKATDTQRIRAAVKVLREVGQ